MAPSFRDNTSATSDSATYTIDLPDGVAEGDILVLAQFADVGTLADIPTPSGWTQLLAVNAAGGSVFRGKLWVKEATGSEPPTFSLTHADSADGVAHLIAVQGGALPTTASSSAAGADVNVTTPGTTPDGTDDLEIRIAAATGNANARTFAPAAGFTEPPGGDVQSNTYTFAAVGYRALTSGAATSNAAWTASGAIPGQQRMGFTVTVAAGGTDATVTPDTVAAAAAVPDPEVAIGADPTVGAVDAMTDVPDVGVSAGSEAHPATVAATADVPAPAVTTEDTELVTPATVDAAADVPDPAVSISTNATLNMVEAVAQLYAPTVTADAHVTLAPVQVLADVPGPSVTVPVLPGDAITRPGQIEWNGFLLGSLTPYSWQELQGWTDSAPFISGNVERSDSSGSYPGQPYMAERAINWSTLLKAPRGQVGQIVHDLVMATGPAQTEDEGWLVVWDFDDVQPWLVRAHLSERLPGPINRQARLGLMSGALQWIASDPRRYDPVRSSLTIVKDVETAILNAGNDATPGELRFPGPATGVQVENFTTDRVIAFSTTIGAGETLVIDVKEGTVAIGDVNHLNDLVEGSTSVQDFVFDPDANRLLYTTTSGGTAGMETFWRHAVS
ncbi:hypothetical protein ITP53_39355 [Nonomuraea sp. K274]|uniref:Siphovirus-type tail component C-terminal domain-containing protein n=1 Tax=Nonomuraea cypriaca TaxID=1187855 RepID=A0A931AFA6_9ACTN|nr:hypothetical protein [Nonomuraea cypriaca]MBF8191651.1 hypothetical protein [Nonomuraea cypriaca]